MRGHRAWRQTFFGVLGPTGGKRESTASAARRAKRFGKEPSRRMREEAFGLTSQFKT